MYHYIDRHMEILVCFEDVSRVLLHFPIMLGGQLTDRGRQPVTDTCDSVLLQATHQGAKVPKKCNN
jgi:hypothetical protein